MLEASHWPACHLLWLLWTLLVWPGHYNYYNCYCFDYAYERSCGGRLLIHTATVFHSGKTFSTTRSYDCTVLSLADIIALAFFFFFFFHHLFSLPALCCCTLHLEVRGLRKQYLKGFFHSSRLLCVSVCALVPRLGIIGHWVWCNCGLLTQGD